MRDVTPSRYRCGVVLECPAAFRLEDGRFAIRGLEVWPSGIIGPNERTVIIDPEMIAEAVKEEKANG